MTRDALRVYCLSLRGAVEEFPFGDDPAVYKVGGKVFALLPLESSSATSISLKCDPDFAVVLRDTYPAVTGGYHLNKRHWNTVVMDGTIAEDEICEWIDHSYALVVAKLTKAQRAALQSE